MSSKIAINKPSHLHFGNWSAYSRLMRLEKPIGIYLLLWPTLWALWLASEGLPTLTHFLVFTLGVVVMRSAGCVINDYADRNIDGQVKRTNQRPLAAKEVTEKETLQLFVLLILIAFSLVLFLNLDTIILSIGGLILAATYPFMKRYTHFPQVVLGAAFSWGMPMAYMAVHFSVPLVVWGLYLANLIWTVAYDTMYAMVDRDDDLTIGVKSTAIFFGKYDVIAIVFMQMMTLVMLTIVGWVSGLSWIYFVSLLICIGFFGYQFTLMRTKERDSYFKAFLNNHYIGLVVFIGIAGHFFAIN